jgi:hypothetical protein
VPEFQEGHELQGAVKENPTMQPFKWLAPILALLCGIGSAASALAACPDLDGDSFCDVAVLRVRLTTNLSSAATPRGKIGMQGEFFTDMAGGDVFDATSDITLQVTDGTSVDQTFTWTPAQCITLSFGRVRCSDPTGKRKAYFTPLRSVPDIVRFKVKAANVDIVGPFLPPVTARFTHDGGKVRLGSQDECRSSVKGLNCRSL